MPDAEHRLITAVRKVLAEQRREILENAAAIVDFIAAELREAPPAISSDEKTEGALSALGLVANRLRREAGARSGREHRRAKS